MRSSRKPELGLARRRNSSSSSEKKTCKICLEKTDIHHMQSLHGCGHERCVSCVRKHLQVRLHEGTGLPTCPHKDCKSRIRIRNCRKVLNPELVKLVKERLKESRIPAQKRIYCPYPKCSYLMSKEELLDQSDCSKRKEKKKDSDKSRYRRKCLKCGGKFCVECKVSWHNGLTCYGYKKRNPYSCAEEKKLLALAKDSRWRRCIKCKHMIELAAGCYHIICRCGYEFCYTCGAEVRNKKATCSCPAWDERYIIDDYNSDYDSNDDYRSDSDFSSDFSSDSSSDSDRDW